MSKNNVNPNHYKVAGRERQGEDIVQVRHKQKHAETLVRQRTEGDVGFRKPAPRDEKASADAGPTRSAAAAARKTRKAPVQTPPTPRRGAAPQLNASQATTLTSVNLQGADKQGKRSTAQKRASTRHEFDAMPATKAVPGAFGREPSPRRLPRK